MTVHEDYRVELEVFEGPLDLLLYLIKREEVDIYDIPIEKITTRYLEYLNMMKLLDLNIAGEFIVMAATLMLIKSRMLLPPEEREEIEEEEDDPRWELVRQLVEYKKFKDAATYLQHREHEQENVFALGKESLVFEVEDKGLEIEDVSLFDLLSAFQKVLSRARPEEVGEIMAERFTVADKIDDLLARTRAGAKVAFSSLFADRPYRAEVICTFLAMLELLRLRQISVSQEQRFGEIVIEGVAEDPVAADAAAGEGFVG